jgi:glutamyl-tRNA synthetase
MTLEQIIEKHAVENALNYGKAKPDNVLGKVLAEKPELRGEAKEVLSKTKKIVAKVNALSRKELEGRFAKYGPKEKKKQPKGVLPELPNVGGSVVLRFAPNPSGPLHIGHARTAILNDEYAKRYDSKLILRIEDTDPKRVDKDAYRMVEEDLKWLGVEIHETIVQSRRLSIYRDIATELIRGGHAYVCSCGQTRFKELKDEGKACPCRGNSVKRNLELWDRIKHNHDTKLALMLKTEIRHKNPAMRDFPIMRVIDVPHPLTGRESDVYPLMNFSVTVDDHLLGVTHVLRGKDHIVNTQRQMFLYDYLDWKPPEFIHNGLMSIPEGVLSTSATKKGIEEGKYTDWGDPSLATIRALKRRGIEAEAVRNMIKMLGCGEVDVMFEWDNLYAENKKIIESKANRYFFVPDPEEVWLHNAPVDISLIKVPLHPDYPQRGFREIRVKRAKEIIRLFIAKKDAEFKKGDEVRLKNFCNIRIMETRPIVAEYLEAKNLDVPKIQWLPEEVMGCEVIGPDRRYAGFCETGCRNLEHGDIIQFERFGFCRVSQVDEDDLICYYAHD